MKLREFFWWTAGGAESCKRTGPSRSGSRMSSRIKSGFELPRLASTPAPRCWPDEFTTQPGEAILHQLDEIEFIIHNQNARCHLGQHTPPRARLNDGQVKVVLRNGNEQQRAHSSCPCSGSHLWLPYHPASSRWSDVVMWKRGHNAGLVFVTRAARRRRIRQARCLPLQTGGSAQSFPTATIPAKKSVCRRQVWISPRVMPTRKGSIRLLPTFSASTVYLQLGVVFGCRLFRPSGEGFIRPCCGACRNVSRYF